MASRRDVLRLAALGTLAACTSTKHPVAAPSPSSSPSTATKPTLAQLGSSLDGELVLPSSAGYASAHQLFNPLFDSVKPAAVVKAASTDDVAKAITFARDAAMPITARSGGHGYTGKSVGTGLVVDLRGLHKVSASAGIATIGAGAQLGSIYTTLNANGASVPGGSCASVGISGLAMGGGYGVVARAHGLTCDAVQSATLVLPDGSVTEVSDGDLLWLLKGGAQAPGIVTEWRLKTFPTSDTAIYSIGYPWPAAADVLAAWLEWVPTLPAEVFSTCKLLATDDRSAGSSPTVGVYGLILGSAADLNPHLDRLQRAIGTSASYRNVNAHSFADSMKVEAGSSTAREAFFAASDFVDAMPASAITNLIHAVEQRQQDSRLIRGGASFDAFGGAIAQVAPDATAFWPRRSVALVQHTATLQTGADAKLVDANRNSLYSIYQSVHRTATGDAYPNYLDGTLADPGLSYFGGNLDRIKQIMQRYDPDGRFARPDLTG